MVDSPDSELGSALRRAGASPERLHEELSWPNRYAVRGVDEARALCAVLAEYRLPDGQKRSPLHALVGLFQTVEQGEAQQILCEEGAPQLARLYDEGAAASDADANLLLFLLKVLVMYRTQSGTERVIGALRRSFAPEAFLWSMVLNQFAESHPDAPYLVEQVADVFPRHDFSSVAFLDLANALVSRGVLEHHPFDSDRGVGYLRDLLMDRRSEMADQALSAIKGAAFLTHVSRGELVELARQSPDPWVQLAALWAGALRGQSADVDALVNRCGDPRVSAKATEYLEELGMANRVPPEVRTPDFRALAEMSRWLAHPMEFGAPPDAIDLYDTRTLYWPPTRDRRQLWLVRYAYHQDEGDDVGIGMVGSVTFALFGEVTAESPVEDVYALHCCWELETNEDPLAPAQRTITAGREILARFNEPF
jgi:hypothetical protein